MIALLLACSGTFPRGMPPERIECYAEDPGAWLPHILADWGDYGAEYLPDGWKSPHDILCWRPDIDTGEATCFLRDGGPVTTLTCEAIDE